VSAGKLGLADSAGYCREVLGFRQGSDTFGLAGPSGFLAQHCGYLRRYLSPSH